MSDETRPFDDPRKDQREDPEGSIHDILSSDELQALLSPLDDGPSPAVLVISDRPEDSELLSGFLKKRGVRMIPARNRFGALDLFRKRDYVAVVADVESLGNDLAGYLRRLREVDDEAVFCFVCPRGTAQTEAASQLARAGRVLERPLDHGALGRFLDFLPLGEDAHLDLLKPPSTVEQHPSDVIEHEEAEHEETEHEETEHEEIGAPVTTSTTTPAGNLAPKIERSPIESSPKPATSRRLDPWILLRTLLESRVEGEESLEVGLLRWLEEDPALSGMVTLDRSGEEWGLRARGVEGERRLAMMRDAVELFDFLPDSSVQVSGSFLVFRNPAAPSSPIALWRGPGTRSDARVEELCARLDPVLPLLGRLAGGSRSSGRETLIEVTATRMRSCERRDGRIAILVAESGGGVAGEDLYDGFRSVLRGSDWVQWEARRVYALLDEPDHGWPSALGTRLRQLEGYSQIRVAGVGWAPSGVDARTLIERGEQVLDESVETPLIHLRE